MVSIRRLDVASFRGIPQLTASLLFDQKSVLLFGENGTGKSSFVDAIEKLLCGRVDSLDDRGQGISSDRHGPHIRAAASRPSISVTFSNPDSKYDLASDSPKVPQALLAYLDAAKQDLFVLRRRDILRFIESQPRDRYTYLRPFLPLAGVQEVENALREARDRSERNADSAQQELAPHARYLNVTIGVQGEPTETSLVQAISNLLTKIGYPAISTMEEVGRSLSLLDEDLAKFGDTTIAAKVLAAITSLRDLLDAIPRESLANLLAACKKLREKEASEARVFYDRVLEDGIRWITEESHTACPLCEQPIDRAAIIASARARLDSMRELITLRKQATTSLSQTTSAIGTVKESLTRVGKSLIAVEPLVRDVPTTATERISAMLASLEQEIIKGLNSLDLSVLEDAIACFQDESHEKTAIAESVTKLQDLVDKLPSPGRANQLLVVRQGITGALESWNLYKSVKTLHMPARAEADQAETVYQRALEARKEVVQELFDKLSKDIDDLYNQLHPGESHGNIRLEVRDVGQGSANLRGSFYDRTDEDPRGYYSDAHLDTLGISIFLALRRWHRKPYPQFNLLVLDDVLTSVDNAHAVRLSELLLREFADYQILLTTHDRIWFEHFRDIQTRCGVSANFVNKVIHKWTIHEGPDLREPQDERDRLKTLVIDGSSSEIAAMAGRLLEHTLQEMRYSLSLRIQAKRGERYEIGELWPPFYKAVKKSYPSFYAQVARWLDPLNINWTIRNWVGAHFNNWAKGASRASAVEFAEAVTGLFDLIFCSECRRFIAPSTAPLGQLSCPRGELIYPAPGREKVVVLDRAKLAKDSDGALRDARFDTALYFEQKRADTAREH